MADQGIVQALDAKRGGPDDNEAQAGHLIAYPTLRGFGHGWQGQHMSDLASVPPITGTVVEDDPLLPLGLDSHRYRTCGNGVVSNVAQAIGQALADEIAREPAA